VSYNVLRLGFLQAYFSAEREAGIHTLSFFPNIPISVDEFLAERNRVQDTLWSSARLLPGVYKLVTHLKNHNIPMAVATSSRRRNFEKKTAHLQVIFSLFEGKIICGDDQQYKMRGKPAPDIFLTAAKALLGRDVGGPDVEHTDARLEERAKGLVFEDAIPGLQAGKRAGMAGMVQASRSPRSDFILTFHFIQLSGYLTRISCSLGLP
jgi:pseudouridine-5'-monophosphatase